MNTYIESMKDDMQGMGMIGTTSTGPGIGKKMQRNAALLLLAAGFALSVAPARAEVHLPNGEYRTSHTDLRVKVLGGYVTVARTWQAIDVNKGKYRWYLNPAWADLDLVLDDTNGETIKSISRTGAKFEKQSDDLFVLKEADHAYFIRVKRDESGHRTGLRWTDRLGNAIDYDANGKIVSYNDRNGIMVHFGRDQDGHITEVRDHNHPAPAPATLTWTWTGDKVTAISDYSGRSVQYHYTGDNLTEFVDVLQHPWGYSYVGAAATPMLHTETDAEGRVTTIDYLGNRVWKVTGPVAGATTTYEYTYDRGSRQYTAIETSPEGKHTESTYDADGKLIRQELGTGSNIRVVSRAIKDSATVDISFDERNLPTRTEYDANRNPIKVTYPDGSTTSATYDGAHSLPLTRTDELGVVTKVEYDTNGNPTTLTEAFGLPEQRVTTYTYDPLGQRLTQTIKGETSADDATTTWTYDAYGNVQAVKDAENHTTAFEYDVQGNATKRTDQRGKDWLTPTNAAGWVTSERDPLGHETVNTYDKVGNRTAVEDAVHNVTRYTYTQSNMLDSMEDPLHWVTSTRYTKDQQRKEVIDANGTRVIYAYDSYGRLTTITDSAGADGIGNVTTLIYGLKCDNTSIAGQQGRLTAIKYPTYCEEYRYDNRGHRTYVSRVLPGSSGDPTKRLASTIQYDAKGQATSEIDPMGRTTTSTYDSFGNLKSTTDATNGVTKYHYDPMGSLLDLTDANQRVHRFTYDKVGRMVTEARPLGAPIAYEYDAAGNLLKRSGAAGDRIVYAYDDAGRRVLEQQFLAGAASPSQTVEYGYDPRNLPTGYSQAGDTASSADYEYDENARKVAESVTFGSGAGAITKTIRYAYEANGRRNGTTYPDGAQQVATYDRDNLASITIKGNEIQFQNYNWKVPTRIVTPGVVRILGYDPLQRPIEIRSQAIGAGTENAPTGPVIMDYRYTYDDAGNIVQRTTEDGDYQYAYDGLDRLTGVTPPLGLRQGAGNPNGLPIEQYTYDALHNRRTSAHQPGAWTYNENNELLSYGAGSEEQTYAYDANGNTIGQKSGDPGAPSRSREYIYNAAERLSEIKDNGITIAKYQYDPMGRRIRKEAQAGVSWFEYGDEGLMAEYSEAGALVRAYGWDQASAWSTNPLWLADISGGTWSINFYHTDNLGAGERLTNGAGNLSWKASKQAFGKTYASVDDVRNPWRFPGQYEDAESSLVYNFLRDYDSATGRYLQPDPEGLFAGVNVYAYTIDNPLGWIDPKGDAATNGYRAPSSFSWRQPPGAGSNRGAGGRGGYNRGGGRGGGGKGGGGGGAKEPDAYDDVDNMFESPRCWSMAMALVHRVQPTIDKFLKTIPTGCTGTCKICFSVYFTLAKTCPSSAAALCPATGSGMASDGTQHFLCIDVSGPGTGEASCPRNCPY